MKVKHDDGATLAEFEPTKHHSFLSLATASLSMTLVFDNPKQAEKFLSASLKALKESIQAQRRY